MNYRVIFTEIAKNDVVWLKKNDPSAFRKVVKLIFEITEHPYIGTGKPKPLKYTYKGCYLRRITQKHSLVYSIDDEKITVLVLSAARHY